MIEQYGDHILRLKAILDIAGHDTPIVLHGVHHTFYEPTALRAWPDSERGSELVLIHDGLPPEAVAELCAPSSLLWIGVPNSPRSASKRDPGRKSLNH